MIKSSKDTRYAIDSVVTHDGMKFPCWALPDLLSFRQKFGEDAYEKVILELIKNVIFCWVLLFFFNYVSFLYYLLLGILMNELLDIEGF